MPAAASLWQRCKGWSRTRIFEPFKDNLKQDAEPRTLALSASMGFFLGLCPVVGVSAGLCILACFLLRAKLHAPMALLFNFVAVPVELLLVLPFMRLGELVIRARPVHVLPEHFSDLLHPGEALKGLGHAVVGWLVVCLLLGWPVAVVLTPAFAFLKKRYTALRRVDSEYEGPLLDGVHGDTGSTVSDVELAAGTPSPTSPLALPRGQSVLSPRSNSNSGSSNLNKVSPHI